MAARRARLFLRERNSVTQSVDASPVVPFWRRIPLFFAFPAHPDNVLRIAALALLASLPFLLLGHAAPWLLWVPATLVAWVMLFRRAYTVLDWTSQGLLSPSRYPVLAQGGHNKPYKQLAVFIIGGMLVSLVTVLAGPLPGMIAYAVFTLATPAAIMLVAIEDSVLSALHPGKILYVMSSIGWPYLLLSAFLFMLSAGQEQLMGWAGVFDSVGLASLTAHGVGMYFTLIMFNMLGYVLYQYHGELGLAVRVSFEDQQRPRTVADPDGERIGALVADGRFAEALAFAYEAQRREPQSVTAHERYHRLLMQDGKRERLVGHATAYLALLLGQRQGERAVALFEQVRAAAPDFHPGSSADTLALAGAAVVKKPQLALDLLTPFERHHPGSSDVPPALLLKAKLMCERFRKDELARLILEDLLTRFPAHPVAAEAAAYARVIERLAQA